MQPEAQTNTCGSIVVRAGALEIETVIQTTTVTKNTTAMVVINHRMLPTSLIRNDWMVLNCTSI